jgi:hypothetical protein
MATATGNVPTGIGLPGVLVAVAMGVTVFESALGTYAVLPSGVMATKPGESPTGIGVPAVFVPVSMGVTLFEF